MFGADAFKATRGSNMALGSGKRMNGTRTLRHAPLALVALVGLAAAIPPSILDFTFYDSSGTEYRSTRVGDQIAKGFGVVGASALLVICVSNSQPAVHEQATTLHGFDFESHRLIWVSTCGFRYDYHTRSPDTEALVSAWGAFFVFLLSGNGRILLHSSDPISAKSLTATLAKLSATTNPNIK